MCLKLKLECCLADKWARRILILEFLSYLVWLIAFQVSF